MYSRSVGRSLITYNIFCSRTIVLGDAVAFLRESYTFVYVMFLAAVFLLLDVLVYSSCSCLRAMQACWLMRVCFATGWLSSGFVLWLAYLIGLSKVIKVGGKQKPYEMWQVGNSLAASPLVNSLAGFAREYGGSAAPSPAPESRQLRRLVRSPCEIAGLRDSW